MKRKQYLVPGTQECQWEINANILVGSNLVPPYYPEEP